jgi:rhodanese-related sulfurtransferase
MNEPRPIHSIEELDLQLDRAVLLEALPERYFADGHLPGARRVDVDTVVDDVVALGLTKAARIIVYCSSATCSNSERAARALSAAGYRDVRFFSPGKTGWIGAGRTLEVSHAS